MTDPIARHPHWPDALQVTQDPARGLKPWSWAADRLEKSHNYWIASASPEGRPHLMVIWGSWIEGSFWFCTGARTRKAKNLAARAQCSIATEAADEAVILEGAALEVSDAIQIEGFITAYNKKYGGNVEPLLKDRSSIVFRVSPQKVFAFDENAENFTESATRWDFPTL
jgi:pyridoxine/pyridoxamine 5'-phosphate oxidase